VDVTREIDPPVIRFVPAVDAGEGVHNWAIHVSAAAPVAHWTGHGEIGVAELRCAELSPSIIADSLPLTCRLSVSDSAGATRDVEALPVRIDRRRRPAPASEERHFEKYALILFDFDRSTVNPANRSLASRIRTRIGPASAVSITAYTDRIGDAAHNQRLSQERATETARTLGVPVENARGVGETLELFDNDIPEGRFYNRTVEVVVDTPAR
jgi:outer membrane protein OmpA-like peptidoglycan-associated protein